MGLFGRRPEGMTPGSEATPADDVLAKVVRVLGSRAFPLEEPEFADFPERCEAWARHLLLRVPPPVGEALPRPGDQAPAGPRAYADLLRFIDQRRTAEARFVRGALGELKKVLVGTLTTLHRAVVDDGQQDAALEGELRGLAEAAETASLPELQQRVQRTVTTMTAQLEAREAARSQQMTRLGAELAQLQTDLYAAQSEAKRDPLTGVDNRAALDAALAHYGSVAEVTGQPLCVLMLDLDRFKGINDAFGHAAGDEVLRAFSRLLVKSFLRKSDFIARYGGEEFCVLLPNTSRDDARRLCERLLATARDQPVRHGDVDVWYSCSAGIAELRAGESASEAVARADRGLYRAKAEGRDRCRCAE